MFVSCSFTTCFMAGYKLHDINGQEIAEITGPVTIGSAQEFLELSMNLPTPKLIVHKRNIDESFFDLRSGLAGEILQKVVNYRLRLAIVGDISVYDSKSLRDFVFESNKGTVVAFVNDLETALARLAS